jgi:hypothetical protein
MTRSRLLVGVILLIAGSTWSIIATPQCGREPVDGYVPNKNTAIRIAVAVLSPIYGDEHIAQEQPFTASLKDGVWTVEGTPPKPETNGGVAEIRISKKDGRVLYVCHGK